MTEDEAKTKWCPMSRVDDGVETYPSFNRSTERGMLIPTTTLCIGSDCMMWRGVSDLGTGTAMGMIIHSGYCGLAGKT